MNEQEILQKLEEQDKKLKEIYESTEKTRKYIFWTLILNLLVFILPLIGLLIIIPQFISLFSNLYSLEI